MGGRAYRILGRDNEGQETSFRPKPPGQVIAMSEAMRMHWKVQVLDNGTGRGRMTNM
jgi:hypothetical protein